jgi:hypothetical protein
MRDTKRVRVGEERSGEDVGVGPNRWRGERGEVLF